MNKVSYRKVNVEGVDKLIWVTSDRGAFGNESDGPLGDWISDKTYFMEKVRAFDVVIQAGGNCGMYPRFYANYFKEVYTFEPDETNFHCLNINCEGDKYHKYYGGLGNTTESLTLKYSSDYNVGMHKITNTPGSVQMFRLDDLNLTACDLLHLDIEGYEPNALLGATKTIQKFWPVVITERSSGEAVLLNLGYVKYRQLRMDTVFIKSELL